MASSLTMRLRTLWLRMSRVDAAALAIRRCVCGAVGLAILLPADASERVLALPGAICAAVYFAVHGWLWARAHLLWSLRNRLIIAYLFIAVVPVLLLVTMAGLAAYLMYWQLGSYVTYSEMEERTS